MAQVKAPLLSFSAQGSLGETMYSHHGGKNYAYEKSGGARPASSPLQILWQEDFKEAMRYWKDMTGLERRFWAWYARSQKLYSIKDCKRPGLTAFTVFVKEWREMGLEDFKWIAFGLYAIYLMALFGWI